ncbi:hypothetical protein SLEP1_g40226 [Rubroshorea leprosula]|uniref:Uncharacterized protein n=1 Tax=Rubroshorea leprosula TaxID=152421 RepID=A0AAV5L345_9ROSI|nr:hypothetical protein SLEP1_g40226 [Rubroshorea leprosula]
MAHVAEKSAPDGERIPVTIFTDMNYVGDIRFQQPGISTRGMLLKRVPSISDMDLVADTIPSMASPRKASATCFMLLEYFQQHG